jgi:uncharacterized Zn-finger protein
MSDLDDEGYDCVSEYGMSGPESDFEDGQTSSTPLTTPSPPHNKRPSDIKKLACHYDDCDKTFNRQARLNEHLRSHTNTRPFKCPHCPKNFLRDSHLKHHVKSAHSNVRDYTCSHIGCGKSFATGTRLRRHEATHSGQNKYTCTGYEGCNQTFRKRETLSRHILQAHEQKKPFPCTEINSNTGETCQKRFDTAEKLKSHQRSMHDPTKFTCTICTQAQAMAYREQSNFDYEVTVPYFSTYSGLKKHVDTAHPPTCGSCSLQFKTPKELSRHVELVHNIADANSVAKEEAHHCPHACGRSFSKKGNLIVHVKTVHEKRRDFVCGQTEVSLSEITSDIELAGCGRDFTSKSTLEEHIRTAHLGMQAKRVERNKKRRAEKREAEDGDGDGLEPKKRRTRKDKGVQKTSAIQSLTGGFPVYRRGSIGQADNYDSGEEDEGDDYSVYDDSSDAGLTSSMVMHGSHIFHGDNTFHFDSGSSSLSTQPPAEPMYQQVNHADAHAVNQLPNFEVEDLQFNHNYDFAGDHSLNMPSTMLTLDLQRQASMPAPQPTQFDLMNEEWYHMQQQGLGYTPLTPDSVPVDPLLSAWER